MRKKLNKLARIVFAIGVALLLANCDRNEPIGQNITTPTISSAKSWFEEYKTKQDFYFIFKDLTYDWNNATTTQLTDGSVAVTVPVLENTNKKNSKKLLYVYPQKDTKNFKIALFELIAKKNEPSDLDLNNFNGYIINWDIINGSSKCILFDSSKPINKIDVKVINKEPITYTSITGKHFNIPSSNDEDEDGGASGSGDAFSFTGNNLLSNVNVQGSGTKPNTNVVIIGTNAGLPGVSSPGGFINSPTGGGGSNNGGTAEINFVLDLISKKVDPKEELKCFDKTSTATLTIYVQQPNENTEDIMGANSVGHAFIGIEQNGIVRQLGFYPIQSSSSALVAVGKTYDSEIRGNNDYLHHVSISKSINSTELNSIINYVENYPKTYNVNSYACTDFAIKVGTLGGIPLKSTTVSSFTYSGRSPGKLGQEIRSMNSTGVLTINKSSGKSPQSKGNCK
jgi:hypothetical protein